MYISVPDTAVREIRLVLLKRAAKLAERAVEDPSDTEIREEIPSLYYRVEEIDKKLQEEAEKKAKEEAAREAEAKAKREAAKKNEEDEDE